MKLVKTRLNYKIESQGYTSHIYWLIIWCPSFYRCATNRSGIFRCGSCQLGNWRVFFFMVSQWVASRLKLPRSEVGGVAWHPPSEPWSWLLGHSSKWWSTSLRRLLRACAITKWLASWLTSKLFRWARPVSSWLAVWILATAWFGTNLGHAGWHVEGALAMWQTCWWSPWTSGRVLLKVANPWFVFRHLSLLTCWMCCPLMEVVWCRPQNVARVVTMACTRSLDFSAVVSRGVEPCREILARFEVSHLHLSCRGCWPWTRVSFPQDFWWHLDGS